MYVHVRINRKNISFFFFYQRKKNIVRFDFFKKDFQTSFNFFFFTKRDDGDYQRE